MKVRVITLKDVIKYLAKKVLILVIVTILANFFYAKKNVNNYIKLDSTKFIGAIKNQIALLNVETNEKSIDISSNSYFRTTINAELSLLETVQASNINGSYGAGSNNNQQLAQSSADAQKNESLTNNQSQENESIPNSKENNSKFQELQILEAPSNVSTEVQSTNIPDKSTYNIFGVNIRNESDYDISTEITDLNVNINKQNVIIFHTHTCESYTQTEQNTYTPSGSYRTTDLNYTVARVGDELEKYLTAYGYNVVHNKTYHDYPSYNGSYDRSLVTVKNLLNQNNNTNVVIDLHRDAIGDNTYAPKVKIGDEYCSRIMLVMGTDGGGLKDDNWRENVKFAIKLVQKGNELYPRTV